jgi:hypothetical protein
MSRARTLLVGLAVWCGVVAVGATLAWVVIARAGAGVVPEATPQAAVTGSLSEPHPRPGPRIRPGTVLTPRAATSPAAPTSTPTSAPTTATPTPTPDPPPPPAPVAERGSWSGTAGHVTAQCDGAQAGLVSAYPNAGFRYQILARGPAAVRVKFLRLGDDDGITVTAVCAAGAPRFSTTGHEPGD